MGAKAFTDFLDNLELAKVLLDLESKYPDPAPSTDRRIIEGLRGGATVLMVAAFENYLKELVEEHLSILTLEPIKHKSENIPYKMRRQNIEQMLESIKQMESELRINEYLAAAKVITSGVIVTQSFTDVTRSNPNAENLKKLFSNLGIPDFFSHIKSDFDSGWGCPTAGTFIQNKLDEILSNRHTVAHRASALNISRLDLKQWLKFLEVLGSVCDTKLSNHIQKFF